jgi:hypothetical protein
VNRKAKRFRKKGCPMFNELVVIFNDSTVKYKDVFPLAQYPIVNEDNLDLEDSSTNDTPSAFPCNSSEGKCYPSQNARRRQRSPTLTSRIGGKREARMVEMGEALMEWTEVTRAMTPRTSTMNKIDTSAFSSAFSITNCVKCLESIEGLDGATYLKAIKMFKDVDWREMFMAMSAERRLIWLASLE